MWQVTFKTFDQTDQWAFASEAKLRFKEGKGNGWSSTLDISQWIRRLLLTQYSCHTQEMLFSISDSMMEIHIGIFSFKNTSVTVHTLASWFYIRFQRLNFASQFCNCFILSTQHTENLLIFDSEYTDINNYLLVTLD